MFFSHHFLREHWCVSYFAWILLCITSGVGTTIYRFLHALYCVSLLEFHCVSLLAWVALCIVPFVIVIVYRLFRDYYCVSLERESCCVSFPASVLFCINPCVCIEWVIFCICACVCVNLYRSLREYYGVSLLAWVLLWNFFFSCLSLFEWVLVCITLNVVSKFINSSARVFLYHVSHLAWLFFCINSCMIIILQKGRCIEEYWWWKMFSKSSR